MIVKIEISYNYKQKVVNVHLMSMFQDLIKPLIINYTIIIALTYTVNMFMPFSGVESQTFKERVYYAFIGSFGGLLCLLFPIEIFGNTNFDFRMVFIMVVTLYSGTLYGFITFSLISIARVLLVGGDFALIGVLVNAIALFSAILFRRAYAKTSGVFRLGTYIYILFTTGVLITIYFYMPFLSVDFYVVYFTLFYLTFMMLLVITEKTIQMNERASEAIYLEKLKTVGNMAAAFAHEIRNPLTTVRGFVQYLNEGDNHKNLKEHAPIILEELDRTNKIITDYLSLAKPSKVSYETLNLTELAGNTIRLLQPIASYKNVNLNVTNINKEDVFINSDKNLLQQSIINVVKNAIEAVDEKGTVIVETKRENDNAIIEIKDNGIGLTKEQLKKIGLPFYTTKSKGTGLGTMVTNRLIEELGGSITYKSEKNNGTVVQISLPIVIKK
jgi:two-component system, sporulation sensor kinase B